VAGSVKKDGSSWYYILELGYGSNGKRKQKKKRGFKTKKEAQAALVTAENELLKGTYIEPSKVLYRDYLHDWMKDKRHSISSQTAAANDSYLRTHIIPSLGDIPMSKLTSLAIQRFITELKEKGLADSTVKRIYNIVNTSLNKAEKMQIIPKNVAALVDKPKVRKSEIKVWDVNEVQQFLEIAKDSRYYVAFHLAVMTGMRQGEILGLRWIDVDFDNKTISIRQTLSHDGKELKSGAKTSSSVRSIAIDDETVAVLQKHRKMIVEEKLKSGNVYTDLGLVVCTSTGGICLPRSLSKFWDKLRSRSNLPKIKFHDLRHTHASLLLKQNVHPKIVSERLGHSSIQMTLDTYSHLLPNIQQDAAKELGKILFPNAIRELYATYSVHA
jgi:integrase